MKSIAQVCSIVLVLLNLLFSPQIYGALLPVVKGSYKLPATIDPTVATGINTELWAEIQRPATGGPYPLIVFLHGNHATCGRFDASLGIRIDDSIQYTTTGTCPAGYVVTPNHLGYRYLAAPLAGNGFVVVSINANRGINAASGVSGDPGLNLRRGRLVLRHLQQLEQWNTSGGAPASLGFDLTGVIDFSKVGLMGHSRGGEGMRAALAQYRDAGSPWPGRIGVPVNFKALYEIGPVDGQTSRILNAPDVYWNVLLPGCDGDVSDLQGIKPLDRMLKAIAEISAFQKSNFQVFGANHNFYNTQWQESDAFGCLGQTALFPQTVGSASQRKTAIHTVLPFFQSHLAPAERPALTKRFDPSYPLPATLSTVTAYARGFSPSLVAADNFIVDEFNNATGLSSRNFPNQATGLTAYSHGAASFNHDSTQRAALVSWNSLSGSLQINSAANGQGVDVSLFKALEFRVLLRCTGSICNQQPKPGGDVDFSIALVNADGSESAPIALKSRAVVRRPAGSFSNNEILQTVRISLDAFSGINLASFHGIKFTFDKVSPASIYLGNIRLTKQVAGDTVLALQTADSAGQNQTAVSPAIAVSPMDNSGDVNQIAGIRRISAAVGTSGTITQNPAVEIEMVSSRRFPVSNALPALKIGENSYTISRFASPATDRLIFTIDEAEYSKLPNAAPVSIRIGGAPVWEFGQLNKTAIVDSAK